MEFEVRLSATPAARFANARVQILRDMVFRCIHSPLLVLGGSQSQPEMDLKPVNVMLRDPVLD